LQKYGKLSLSLFGNGIVDWKSSDSDTLDNFYLNPLVIEGYPILAKKRQFALIVEKDNFEKRANNAYENVYKLNRENVIAEIIKKTEKDLIVSTTGKISREVYEKSDTVLGHHNQCFLTVGGMGHASMIAFSIAKKTLSKRIICMDGDGAALMHLGNLAFIGNHAVENLVHMCLNKEAHESEGGMPTCAQGFKYAEAARVCGYSNVFVVQTAEELSNLISNFDNLKKLTFIEIKVANTSRDDLVRPKESAGENAVSFMGYIRSNEK
jgi:phosphonopyruvate decarboxylase